MGSYDHYKKSVFECGRWLSGHGYFGTLRGTGGNVSLRVEGQPVVAVTPSRVSYRELTPEDICIVDFDLKVIEGKFPPSVETRMHLAVYKARPDVNAVVHTHQAKASALSLINQSIPALYDEVVLHTGSVVEVIPYAFSGSPELIENVKAKLGNRCHCYLLQNHGALSLGATIENVLLNVELLEKLAQTYLDALSTGREITLLPASSTRLLAEMSKDARNNAAGKNRKLPGTE